MKRLTKKYKEYKTIKYNNTHVVYNTNTFPTKEEAEQQADHLNDLNSLLEKKNLTWIDLMELLAYGYINTPLNEDGSIIEERVNEETGIKELITYLKTTGVHRLRIKVIKK